MASAAHRKIISGGDAARPAQCSTLDLNCKILRAGLFNTEGFALVREFILGFVVGNCPRQVTVLRAVLSVLWPTLRRL